MMVMVTTRLDPALEARIFGGILALAPAYSTSTRQTACHITQEIIGEQTARMTEQ